MFVFSQPVLNRDGRANEMSSCVYSIEKRGVCLLEQHRCRSSRSCSSKRTERSRVERCKCRASSVCQLGGPKARRGARIRGTGPRVFRRWGPRKASDPRHATRIRNEYKYIERSETEREREKEILRRRGEFALVLVTSESYTHSHARSFLLPLSTRGAGTRLRAPAYAPYAACPADTGTRWVPEYAQCPLGFSTPRAGRTKDDDATSLKVLMRVASHCASIAFHHVFYDRVTRPNHCDEVSTRVSSGFSATENGRDQFTFREVLRRTEWRLATKPTDPAGWRIIADHSAQHANRSRLSSAHTSFHASAAIRSWEGSEQVPDISGCSTNRVCTAR